MPDEKMQKKNKKINCEQLNISRATSVDFMHQQNRRDYIIALRGCNTLQAPYLFQICSIPIKLSKSSCFACGCCLLFEKVQMHQIGL